MDKYSISVERTFNLGDYNNLKVGVTPTDVGEDERTMNMLENVFELFETLFWHQIIRGELYNIDTDEWKAKMTHLHELKEHYFNTKEDQDGIS